ncbi:MAG: 4-(cytidine 5'-diphospho)-2-C-methyl-D-erythritol kinase [Acidobacteria bacterium]|nr:4-(cytidine 5'-diphospho)-2-C-methyl-D-erythritol kinase [Acidobacteriota bacterium]MCA1639642.1 4-(cytidine 5'-diphospho)-2-C-methyl-D-erythritol kinase [Acidobacteriota bacterium]
MENTFTIPSFAKINWFLRIMGKREDNFHELCTVFQTISLADYLTFSEQDEIVLICNDKKIPPGEANLVVKAAKFLQEKLGIKKGAKIYLEKNIPAPGGLGGGSSNAAVALCGLTKLWRIEIDFAELLEIGKNLGSDVPFFFYGGTALGAGRGTEIYPLKDLEEKHILIVTPNVNVSTAEAFAALNAPHLTNKSSKSILPICRDFTNSLILRQSKLINDFEAVVFKLEPEVEFAKKKLLDFGSQNALLSGSGASVFGIFDSEKSMQFAFEQIKSATKWRVFSVRTISRSFYRNSLKVREDLLLKDF